MRQVSPFDSIFKDFILKIWLKRHIALSHILWLYLKRGNNMGTKVKPVQSTEIKDKRIAREVIEQIRRKPSVAALKRHKEQDEALVRLLKK